MLGFSWYIESYTVVLVENFSKVSRKLDNYDNLYGSIYNLVHEI